MREAEHLSRKLDYPLARLVLAIGGKAEDALRQSTPMSRGSLKIFVDNALVTTLVGVDFALLPLPPLLREIGGLA